MNATIYPISVTDISGNDLTLDQYKGKVVLIVNVASACGYTPQYADLEAYYEAHKDEGFVILGFPCNDFGAQEPGSEAEIAQFCRLNYGVSFPMFSKVDIKGDHPHPLYSFLTQKSQNGVADAEVRWNFHKFLIGRDGQVIGSYPSGANVTEGDLPAAIGAALKH